jgi:hypothetical protein
MVKLVSVATPSGAAPDWRKGSSTALINRFVNMGCGPEPPENRQAEPHCGYGGPFWEYREAEAYPKVYPSNCTEAAQFTPARLLVVAHERASAA